MIVKPLYRYKRADGGITVSPIKPDCEYTELYRLVASEGKSLTKDNENFCQVIDTENSDGWYEVDTPNNEK